MTFGSVLVHSPALRETVAQPSGPEDALHLKTFREEELKKFKSAWKLPFINAPGLTDPMSVGILVGIKSLHSPYFTY